MLQSSQRVSLFGALISLASRCAAARQGAVPSSTRPWHLRFVRFRVEGLLVLLGGHRSGACSLSPRQLREFFWF